MASNSHSDEPLQELKHEAVPGYRKAFVIAFAVMAIYLAVILISSPGSAKSDYGHDKKGDHSASEAKH